MLLHFQAVDYDATVWVDGVEVGRHRGGFTPFSIEVDKRAGDRFALVVRARDTHTEPQPRGKQAMQFKRDARDLLPNHGHLADGLDGTGVGTTTPGSRHASRPTWPGARFLDRAADPCGDARD